MSDITPQTIQPDVPQTAQADALSNTISDISVIKPIEPLANGANKPIDNVVPNQSSTSMSPAPVMVGGNCMLKQGGRRSAKKQGRKSHKKARKSHKKRGRRSHKKQHK